MAPPKSADAVGAVGYVVIQVGCYIEVYNGYIGEYVLITDVMVMFV